MGCFSDVTQRDYLLESIENSYEEKEEVRVADTDEMERRLKDLRGLIKEAKVDW